MACFSPIFVGGDGRSGTTLLSVMLDSHPDLVVLPELHFNGPDNLGSTVLEVLDMLDAGDWRATTPGYQRHPAFKAPVQFVRRCERAGVERSELRAEIRAVQSECGTDLSAFTDRAELIDRLGTRRAARENKKAWGLKIMKQIRQAEKYRQAWPECAFVNVVRDGRDVAASQILDHNWGYTSVAEAISGWSSLTRQVRDLESHIDAFWSVRYEDVVEDPKGALGPLLEAIGLSWDDRMVRFYELEHAVTSGGVAHPSREALGDPLNDRSVGRHVRDLPTPWVRKFTTEAGEALEEWGYEKLPIVEVMFGYGKGGCQGGDECKKRIDRARERLGERYLSAESPFERQVRAAWLNVEGVEYEAFLRTLKKMSKGVQEYRKAERMGVRYGRFERQTFLPDIVAVNHSKEYRAAGKMRDAYLKSVEDMGGYPTRYEAPREAECCRHNDTWWGAFVPNPGYTQGDVVTDEKLVAYINLRTYGDFAFYNLILGHGEYMDYGVVMGLHLAVVRWVAARADDISAGLRTLVYAGYYQGSEGLQSWKKKAGFCPGYLISQD